MYKERRKMETYMHTLVSKCPDHNRGRTAIETLFNLI